MPTWSPERPASKWPGTLGPAALRARRLEDSQGNTTNMQPGIAIRINDICELWYAVATTATIMATTLHY